MTLLYPISIMRFMCKKKKKSAAFNGFIRQMEEWCRRAVLKCSYVHCIYTEYSIHRRIGILCHHTEIKGTRLTRELQLCYLLPLF